MKSLRNLRWKLTLIAALATGTTSSAFAQWVVFDPANFTQSFMTAAQTLQSNIQAAQQIQNQLTMYQNMMRNTASLPQSVWVQASGTLNQLANVVQTGQGISYAASNLDSQFRTAYPGYTAPTNYTASYQQLTQSSLDSMRGAMNAAGVQNANFANEASAIDSLRVAAQGADGQKAAIDAGNQIAVAQIGQMQEMRQLMMAQMQSQTAYQATQLQKQATNDAQAQQALQYVDPMSGYTPKVATPGSGN